MYSYRSVPTSHPVPAMLLLLRLGYNVMGLSSPRAARTSGRTSVPFLDTNMSATAN